jgi:hypothetical protein
VYRGPSSESPEIHDTLDTLGSLEFVVIPGPPHKSPEIHDTLDTLGSLEFVVIPGPPHKSPEIHDTLDTLGSLGVKSVMDSGGVCSRTQTNYKLLGGVWNITAIRNVPTKHVLHPRLINHQLAYTRAELEFHLDELGDLAHR